MLNIDLIIGLVTTCLVKKLPRLKGLGCFSIATKLAQTYRNLVSVRWLIDNWVEAFVFPGMFRQRS